MKGRITIQPFVADQDNLLVKTHVAPHDIDQVELSSLRCTAREMIGANFRHTVEQIKFNPHSTG